MSVLVLALRLTLTSTLEMALALELMPGLALVPALAVALAQKIGFGVSIWAADDRVSDSNNIGAIAIMFVIDNVAIALALALSALVLA